MTATLESSIHLTPRHVLAEYLRGDSLLLALLPGGIYPLEDSDQREIDRTGTPLAFDSSGDVRPSALIASEGTVNFGPLPRSALTVIRVIVYQRRGRDAIDAANHRIAELLAPALPVIWDRISHVSFAGFGPDTERDPTLRNADMGWSRWQLNHLIPWGNANGYAN